MKLKIAIFEPKISELKKVQSFLTSSTYDVEVFRASNVDAATKIINEQNHFHFIFLNVRMSPYQKINTHFIQTVLARFSDQKFILLYSKEEHKDVSELTNVLVDQLDYDPWMELPFKPLQFFKVLEQSISELSKFVRSDSRSQYTSIKAVELLALKTSPCDVFIKLGDEKYVKVFNSFDPFDATFFEKYKVKGVRSFFVERACFNKHFNDFFPPQLVARDSFNSDEEYALGAQKALFGVVAEFGISEDVVETATELAEEAVDILEKNNLTSMLALLKNGKDSFIYDHSFLLSLICLETAKKFKWYSSKHNRIICLSSLLHDASLTDPRFHSIELGGLSKLENCSKEEQVAFKDHPLEIANELKRIMDIPSDVIGLVLKHHEGFGTDKSFPYGHYSQQLSALECIFVMSHEIVLIFYRNLFHPDKIEHALLQYWEELHKGNFRKYIKELQEVVESILTALKGEA